MKMRGTRSLFAATNFLDILPQETRIETSKCIYLASDKF